MELSETSHTSTAITIMNGKTSIQPPTVAQTSDTPTESLHFASSSLDDFANSNLDDHELLAERKQSQIQALLQQFKKLDTLTELYKAKADDNSKLEFYERDTYLGKPPVVETPNDEEPKDNVSTVSLDPMLAMKIHDEKKKQRYNPLEDKAFLVDE